MAAAKFLLEHFYYGQLVHHGQATGEPRLLAASTGVDSDLAALAVQRVNVPPLVDAPLGSFAIVRGREKELPFLIIQSQQGTNGQLIAHYIIATPDVMRALSGNLAALAPYISEPLPTYETLGDTLPKLEIEPPTPLSVDDQVDDVLDLMTHTRNKIQVIEDLVAAIVQGVQIAVIHAPPHLQPRIEFIEGLLALLPRSARFAVTFTTHSLAATDINAQIRFIGGGTAPEKTLVYDWRNGTISGEKAEDEYSRFVISQLRLDAELVIQRTSAMTHIAAYRINNGDRLADALGYAAKRLRIDEALRTNQPVNTNEVAKILANDPTLDDQLNQLYADHLLKFSLAMRNMEQTESIALLLNKHPEIEQVALEQMALAQEQGEHEMVYDTIITWLANPLGPQSTAWVDLLQKSGLALLEEIVEDNDIEDAEKFLDQLQSAGTTFPLDTMIPQVVRVTMPLSVQDNRISDRLFRLAVKFLDDDALAKLMSAEAFFNRLPSPVKAAWVVISRGETHEKAPQMLVAIAEEYSYLVMLRFVEMAMRRNLLNIVQTPVVNVLRDFSYSDEAPPYTERIITVVSALETHQLTALEPPGAMYLLQIRLALGDYITVGNQMIQQSAALYPGDLQYDYLKMVEKLFTDTPLSSEATVDAINGIVEAGVKAAPYVTAAASALNKQDRDELLDSIAEECIESIVENPRWLEVIPSTAVLAILGYYARARSVEDTIKASAIIPASAAHSGSNGVRIMAAMYKRMNWNARTRLAALQMLRAFVREAQDEDARKAVGFFGRELGKEVRRALEVTYTIRRFMNDMHLTTYAEALKHTADLLMDTAGAFINPRNTPAPSVIMGAIENLPGNLPRDEKGEIAQNILRMGRSMGHLSRHSRGKSPRDNTRYINALLTGETNPRSALDVMRVMGGYFARGRHVELKITEPPAPLGEHGHTLLEFRDIVSEANDMLYAAVRTVPPNKTVDLTAGEIRAEIESIWGTLSEEQHHALVRDLAANLQQIPDLIEHIEENGDVKALDDDSSVGKRIDSGKQKPRNTIEMYRYLYGYFRSRS